MTDLVGGLVSDPEAILAHATRYICLVLWCPGIFKEAASIGFNVQSNMAERGSTMTDMEHILRTMGDKPQLAIGDMLELYSKVYRGMRHL